MSLLYHYTNINGLLGILRPQDRDIKLWFTDVRYQNDISEGKELTRIYKKVCKTMKARGEISEEDYKKIVSIKFNNKRPIAYTPHDVTQLYYGETDVYICCFCRNSDSLNMWRYYTKDNTGCALGFMEGKLERNTRREQFEPNDNAIGKLEFWSVIYDETEKEGFIYSEILNILKKIAASQVPKAGNLKRAIEHGLGKYKFKFKHECFSSEEEVRGIYYVPHNDEKLPKEKKNIIRYRSQYGMIVPYIEMSFPREAIKEVRIAPNASEDAAASIKNYLKANNPGTHVKQSELPIRF